MIKPEIVKGFGAQLAGDPPDLIEGRLKLRGERGHSLALALGPLRGCPLDLKDHRGQGLASLVVKRAGDTQPLALLGNERCARPRPSLIGQAFQHRVEGIGEGGQLDGLGRTSDPGPLRMA